MRVIDREQAQRVAGLPSIRRANARLLALTRAGLLKRFFIGTAVGWRKSLYSLTKLGAKLVQAPARTLKRQKDEIVTLDVFIYHQLGLNEIYCALKYGPASVGAKVEKWSTYSKTIDRDRSLIPDGYAEIASEARVVPAFVELDLGNESLTTWKAKVGKYVRYAMS